MSEATLLLAGVAMSFLFGSLNDYQLWRRLCGHLQDDALVNGEYRLAFPPVIANMPMAAIFLLAFVTAPELNLSSAAKR